MIKIIIYILAIFSLKIYLIKKENEIAKCLIVLEKRKSKIWAYFLILGFFIIFFYESTVFFYNNSTYLILIYLFNNFVLTLFMKYFILKIYYFYYNQTIKVANFSLHNLRIKIKKKYFMLLCFFHKKYNIDFISTNISENNRKLIVHIINFLLLFMYGPIVYINMYFCYSVTYFYIFVMDDRNDGFVNRTFFREKVLLNSEGNKKLLNYGKYLINTNNKIPSLKRNRDFEYVNHECH